MCNELKSRLHFSELDVGGGGRFENIPAGLPKSCKMFELKTHAMIKLSKIKMKIVLKQWQIQDFLEGAPTHVGVRQPIVL